METRDFGRLGPVSALTLGGGGIGGVLGPTDRAEAVATVHAALDAGITSLDVAPTYGIDSEAEQVVGAALRKRPAPEVMITTKVELPDDEYDDLSGRMRSSLEASLRRLGRNHVDLFLAHSQLRPAGSELTVPRTLGWERYVDEVVPTFTRLQDEGLIRGWGLTAVGYPSAILAALATDPRPYAAQMVVNALDLSGDMWIFGDAGEPQNPALVTAAAEAGVPVMAIRAVASGALTDQLDREPNHPTRQDYVRAAGFRALAADLGETPAALAHRYALSMTGVSTVVLGVKNRRELAEVVTAEAAGPLSTDEMQAIGALRA
ncbi:MAG TPA: aldo/keto reductase [Propionibacteriaceae bacterium]|nr:aldo/keto reductase [Propionibacteriaceae bacterium]